MVGQDRSLPLGDRSDDTTHNSLAGEGLSPLFYYIEFSSGGVEASTNFYRNVSDWDP